MSTETRLRRGTTAQHAGFTGAQGEVTVDTDKKTAVVHDGVTLGGIPLMRADATAGQLATDIHAATTKATPVDADELGLVDSAASNGLKKLTWANLKAALVPTGVWTPALKFGGASVGMTTSLAEGTYVRIGNFVFCTCTVILTAKGSSTGAATITGLPFSAAKATGADLGFFSGLASITSQITGYIFGATLTWYQGGSSALTQANFTDTTNVQLSFSFTV